MKGLTLYVAIAVSTISFPTFGWAAMECNLDQITQVSKNGTLVPHALSSLSATTVVVDLDSGKVFHPLFGNEFYSDRRIVDQGGNSSSFKVFASSPAKDGASGSFRNASFFQINTYEAGSKKSFVVVEGNVIGFGICE